MGKPVVVVGAGLAGLVCARRLHRAGVGVVVLEKADGPGGRVRTDTVDEFRIDRGFQALFTSYPSLSAELDLGALDLHKFKAGCLVEWDGKLRTVSRDDRRQMLFSSFLSLNQKFRIRGLGESLATIDADDLWGIPEMSVLQDLKTEGLAGDFAERFVRPFFGGVFLDRSLDVSRRVFRYLWKMLYKGDTAVPAMGMQALPDQIAADLPDSVTRFGQEVVEVVRHGAAAEGVRLADGTVIDASAVVVATEGPAMAALIGSEFKLGWSGCTTLAFDANNRPYEDPILTVNGNAGGSVNHVAVMSNVAASLAPQGRHLVSATVLGVDGRPDDELADAVRGELQGWFRDTSTRDWRLLKVDRIPFAQFKQPPGFQSLLPTVQSATPGLFVAGECTTFSSLDGACRSGADCARTVIGHLEAP